MEGLPIFKNFSKVDSEPETPTEPEEPQIPTESEINYYLVIQKDFLMKPDNQSMKNPGITLLLIYLVQVSRMVKG